jgi:hypothetical protein
MPSNKILVILIVCIGVVTSTYLIAKNSSVFPNKTENVVVSANQYINLSAKNNGDWQKILVDVDSTNSTTTILSGAEFDVFDETSLTAQLSRDFFSRYLLIGKKDGGITTDEANKIAEEVLSVPEYTKTKEVTYITENIKINSKTDRESVLNYRNALELISQNRRVALGNPIEILNKALSTESEKDLSKLDPFILAYKGTLNDLVKTEVPVDAVELHLAVLNSYSSFLSILESIRVILKDPVRGVSGISRYEKNILDREKATSDLDKYFEKKLGPLQ